MATVDQTRIGQAPLLRADERIITLAACSLFATVVAIGVGSGAFGISAGALVPIFAAILVLHGCGYGLLRLRVPAFPDFLQVAALFFFLAALAALCSAVLAGTALPYADARLAAADALLGFHWPVMAVFLHRHALCQSGLVRAYFSLNWQPLLLILLLCMFRSRRAAHAFVAAQAVALVITLAIFPFVPAIAAYRHFHLAADTMPLASGSPAWWFQSTIEGIRSGAITTLDERALGSFVTMPSFHAASAVILARQFWTFRLLRWPAAALNLAMLVAAIPIGGHYLVDVLAGVLVGLIAEAVIRRSPFVR